MRRRGSKPPGSLGSRIRSAFLALAGLCLLVPLAGGVAISQTKTSLAGLPAADLSTSGVQGDYVIGPQDKLRIRVFEVKDLSFDEEQVDANGQIYLPLIGRMTAAGKTTLQLQDELAQKLGEKYLQSPQVSVSVAESASQKVTVEGEVKQPGVFQMRGRTTLMQAIAMAGGPSDIANLRKVAIIRESAGQRRAAVVDFQAIRDGKAGDPVIEGNDVVVMDSSSTKSLWSNVMKNLPIFTLLAYLR
ncbi:MAG TPA: polysaccharide biosynthesis/export family protein [Caulobacteraceae bacterium]|jgi:polysaccharide export outer membrane protein|nr:polysaccharide biosynthesis/export family protein [Caulobacteraceae bacterium]